MKRIKMMVVKTTANMTRKMKMEILMIRLMKPIMLQEPYIHQPLVML